MKRYIGLLLFTLVNLLDYINLLIQGWRPVKRIDGSWVWRRAKIFNGVEWVDMLVQGSAVSEMKKDLLE